MLRASPILTSTVVPGTVVAAGACLPYEVIPALLLTTQPITWGSILTDPAPLAGQVCLPPDPTLLSAERTVSLLNWRLPPADPAERVVYAWESLNAWVPGAISIAFPRERLPVCDAATVIDAAPAPPAPDAIRMPDLQRFGENQAREQLAALGITSIFVDYQTRERIPDVYDAFAPYAVVSTLPAAGEWVVPADTVVLGVRAPDP
jgi:peptidoglycan glycosyltransferase